MVLIYCFYKIHQLLIIVNVNNKQKPFTHPTVNPFFNDYEYEEKSIKMTPLWGLGNDISY
jgi:hypothetical protein